MRDRWLEERIMQISSLAGYVKPEEHPGALKLDSNENMVIPKDIVSGLLQPAVSADMRQYPLGRTQDLTDAIASHIGVPADTVGVGHGSDQILDMILANFATDKTRVLASDPTFAFFSGRCSLYRIPVTGIPFSDEMRLDAADFASKKADILYLDVPNNPTGFAFAKKDLEELVRGFEGLVIIDEAYGDFAPYSLAGMAKKQDNLVVTRTFSKSFGMAGLRLGYYASNAAFADAFNRVIQYPYPVNAAAIEAALALLSSKDALAAAKAAVSEIKSERSMMMREMRKYGAFEVFDSEANFVLFDARGAYKRIYTALAEQGISIRKLGRIGGCEGCLRVTVGTKEANSRFLLALRDLLQ